MGVGDARMIKLDPPCGFCGCRWVGDWGWPHFCKELIHGTPVMPTFTLPVEPEPELMNGRSGFACEVGIVTSQNAVLHGKYILSRQDGWLISNKFRSVTPTPTAADTGDIATGHTDRKRGETCGQLGEMILPGIFPGIRLTLERQSNRRGIMDASYCCRPRIQIVTADPKRKEDGRYVPGNIYVRHHTILNTRNPHQVYIGGVRYIGSSPEEAFSEGALWEAILTGITFLQAVKNLDWRPSMKKEGKPWEKCDRLIPWKEALNFPFSHEESCGATR
jgi:hypothetical protein